MEAIAVCRRQWDDGNDGNEFLAKIAFFNQKLPKNDLFELFDGLILSHWNRSPTQIEVNSIRSRQYNLLKSKNKRSISTWIFGFYGLLFLCCKVIFLFGDNWFSFSYPKLNKSIKKMIIFGGIFLLSHCRFIAVCRQQWEGHCRLPAAMGEHGKTACIIQCLSHELGRGVFYVVNCSNSSGGL